MRVQGTLIWNISPLMSSTEPPVMYSTSLWSVPYESGAPTRLLYAQEIAFLKDLREAIDKRVENKIASARRFAVNLANIFKPKLWKIFILKKYYCDHYSHIYFIGSCSQSCKNGGLLPYNILQPQILLWKQKEDQRRHH